MAVGSGGGEGDNEHEHAVSNYEVIKQQLTCTCKLTFLPFMHIFIEPIEWKAYIPCMGVINEKVIKYGHPFKI